MSKRNSHAAKALRRAERQGKQPATDISHAQIAEAVHQAVCQATGTNGFRQCIAYAVPGAAVASVITGQPHIMQAGGIEVLTGDVTGEGEAALVLDPLSADPEGGVENQEFHAWFSPEPVGLARGVVTSVRRDDLIIADLSMRHFSEYCAAAGAPWSREPLPAYCWASAHQIGSELRVVYRPDPQTTMAVNKRASLEKELLEDITSLALHRLGVISTRKLDELLHSPQPFAGSEWSTDNGVVFTRG